MLKHRLNQLLLVRKTDLLKADTPRTRPSKGSSCSIDHAQVGLQRGRIPKQTCLMRPLGPVQTGVA
jgi:hypothetical protein